jgi:branched-chain amino acid transport system permease protein
LDRIIFEACVNNPEYLGNLLINGLIIGAIYALMALGLTLIFSVLGIVSFAHGEFYMIGGFLTYFLLEYLTPLPWVAAILLDCFYGP